jgi:hypothetical protein
VSQLLKDTYIGIGKSLYDVSYDKPILILFMRHSGCPFFREFASSISEAMEQGDLKAVIPVIVHMETEDCISGVVDRFGLEGCHMFMDQNRNLYSEFGVEPAGLIGVLGIKNWVRLLSGPLFKFGVGRVTADPMQMAAAFILRDGMIVAEEYCESSSEIPDLKKLVQQVS